VEFLSETKDKIKARYKVREPRNFKAVLRDELEHVAERRGEPIQQPINDPVAAAHRANLFGLALSGGGIRSATFNLGLLEALAKYQILEKLDYISSVSGGGYINGWLTAWIKRDGQQRVQDILGSSAPPEVKNTNIQDNVSVDPYPITHLRRYTNYLTPKVGLLSLDTFVLVATYLRNLSLNLLLIGATSTALVFLVRMLVKLFSKLEGTELAVANLTAIAFFLSFAGLLTAIQLNRSSLVPSGSRDTDDEGAKDNDSEKDKENDESEVRRPKDRTYLLIVLPIFLASTMFAQMNVDAVPFNQLLTALYLFYISLWGFLSLLVFWRHLRRPHSRFRIMIRFMTLFLIFLVSVPTALVSTWMSHGLLFLFATDWFVEYIPALGGPLVLCAVYISTVVFIGLAGRALTEEQRQWLSRLGAWLILSSILWAIIFLIVQFGPRLLETPVMGFELFGLFLLAWPTISAAGAYSGHGIETQQKKAGIAKRVFMQVTPYVFIVGLLLFNSHIVAELLHAGDIPADYALLADDISIPMEAMLAAFLLGCAGVMSWRFDINEFSMNNFYKTRLIRAYLGASNIPRNADTFTDFDRKDDIPLSKLRYNERKEGQKYGRYDGPIPIINCALNLVGTRQLALQERKADSLSITPYFFGFEHRSSEPRRISGPDEEVRHRAFTEAAYREIDSYEKEIHLGDSIAVSGAAVSPNMGYRSTAGLAFLLTVFNIRLGAWVANPKVSSKLNRLTPRFAFLPLISEMFARTNEDTKHVYLSDGGHFENLGLYELVRRRCRYIVVSDAGADPSMEFADLSNAIRKIRTDFGFDIDIDVSEIEKDEDGISKSHIAVGTIHYDRIDQNAQPGFLIYIKASVTGNEPADITGFRKEHSSFPHQSTADQWFTESQFSSYRVLGKHIVSKALDACGSVDWDELALEELFSHLRRASYPRSKKIKDQFTDHAAKLQGLLADLSTDSDLGFLDHQLFPDSFRFRDEDKKSNPDVWNDATEFRKGFYFCSRLLQLMENVFIDLRMDREFEHPDNRGWMNLFNHWTSAPMLRITWAISASTYGSRFQKFCEDHFELKIDSIEAERIPLKNVPLKDFAKTKLNEKVITGRELARINLIAEKLPENELDIGSFWRFQIVIPAEKVTKHAPDGFFRLPCGFALNDTNDKLVFLRVRDHLRGLGLTRPIVNELSRQQKTPIEMSDKARSIYEGIVRYPQKGRYFEILMHSLRSVRHSQK